jgi:transcriptional regulator GlxA family with amidase domain
LATWLRYTSGPDATDRGATLAAHCLGVFHLAATGLLDNLNATTHWQYADQLTARYPRVRPHADEPPLVRPPLQGGHRRHTARLAAQPAT